MGMNIKNVETERLIRELATLTGESLTTALTVAVRERLERVRGAEHPDRVAQRVGTISALGHQIAPRLTEPWASRDHGELLYDESGLPG